jgi:hypothetical protein
MKLILCGILLASSAFAEGDEKKNEIGWEDGVRYMYHGYPKFNVGFKVNPFYGFSDQSSEQLDYSFEPANGQQNSEDMNVFLGLDLSREYGIEWGFFLEPYAEMGYGFSRHEVNTASENPYPNTASRTEAHQNIYSLEMGAKPGIKIKKWLKIYTRFGGRLSKSDVSGEFQSQYSKMTTDATNWSFSTFGERISLNNGLYLAILF